MSKHRRKIAIIFKSHILPLHEAVKAGEIPPYFAMQPVMEEASYYETPKDSGKTYFSFFNNEDEDRLQREMEQLWDSLGTPELKSMASKLSKLALKFKADQIQQASEVSEYIYVMY